MADITQHPRGLVSLTGLRDMGEAPRDLSQSIAPTIDITQFLLLNRELVSVTDSPAAVATRVVTTVPAGELWYIHSFGVYATCGVGQTIALAVGIGQNNSFIPQGTPDRATAGQVASAFLKDPIWLGPGSFLILLVKEIVAGPINVECAVSFSRLRI